MRLSPKQVTPFFWIRSNIGELVKMRRQDKVRNQFQTIFKQTFYKLNLKTPRKDYLQLLLDAEHNTKSIDDLDIDYKTTYLNKKLNMEVN